MPAMMVPPRNGDPHSRGRPLPGRHTERTSPSPTAGRRMNHRQEPRRPRRDPRSPGRPIARCPDARRSQAGSPGCSRLPRHCPDRRRRLPMAIWWWCAGPQARRTRGHCSVCPPPARRCKSPASTSTACGWQDRRELVGDEHPGRAERAIVDQLLADKCQARAARGNPPLRTQGGGVGACGAQRRRAAQELTGTQTPSLRQMP